LRTKLYKQNISYLFTTN